MSYFSFRVILDLLLHPIRTHKWIEEMHSMTDEEKVREKEELLKKIETAKHELEILKKDKNQV